MPGNVQDVRDCIANGSTNCCTYCIANCCTDRCTDRRANSSTHCFANGSTNCCTSADYRRDMQWDR